MSKLLEWLHISSSPYVNAAVTVLVFIILARIADFIVDKVIRRFAQFTKTEVGGRLIDIVHRPVFFTIILFGISIAFTYLKPADKTVFYTDGILYSVIAVIWMVAAIKLGDIIIENAFFRVSDVTGLGKDVVPLVKNVSKIVVVLAGIMVILSLWRVNIAPVIASAGIAGAAVALAAKDTIANFLGGISLFVDKPFKIGDFIVLDRGERGEVVAIGIRSTRVRTLDGIMITIPNAVIINTKIVNESAKTPYLRICLPVAVAYGSDIELVEKILVELAGQNRNIVGEPAPKALFTTFGDGSLHFELLFWIEVPALRGAVVDEMNRAIYRKFREHGIEFKSTIPAAGCPGLQR